MILTSSFSFLSFCITGIILYTVPELKAIGSFMSLQPQLTNVLAARSGLQRPSRSALREDWKRYVLQIFQLFQMDPSLTMPMINPVTGSMPLATSSIPALNQLHASASVVHVGGNYLMPTHFVPQPPMHSLNQMSSSFAAPTGYAGVNVQQRGPQHLLQRENANGLSQHSLGPAQSIEYFKGIECIDMIRYPDGLPGALLYSYQQISQYKGYPSKLRYMQIIKQEKLDTKKSTPTEMQPATPFECHAVNTLKGMGCTDTQEIMSSLKHIQSQNPSAGSESIIEQVLMHIVCQREEKSEAEKMDQARIQSEQFQVLHERNDEPKCTNYTDDEMLGFVGSKSIRFPKSYLLESPKVKTLFHSLLQKQKDDGTVRDLFEIENKAIKYYGDSLPEPFFTLLRVKIEIWHDEFLGEVTAFSDDGRSVLVDRIKNEIELIQRAMYSLSEQDEALQVPRLFISSKAIAIEKGLMSRQKNDVIIIDDD